MPPILRPSRSISSEAALLSARSISSGPAIPPARPACTARTPGSNRRIRHIRRAGLAVVLSLAAAVAASAREFQAIKGESSLTYVLVHPMHTITAVNRNLDCTVDLSADTVSSTIRVAAGVKDFDSGNSSRDSHALEVVEYRKYPKVEFASTSIRPAGDGYDVAGDLTFHGKTRPVAFHVTPTVGPERIEIKGSFSVKLSEFDVPRPRLMLIPVKDDLKISFDLFAKP